MSRVIIVIPCYNEARRLDLEAIRAFAREDSRADFLFVDDGSTDATRDRLADLCREAPGRFLVEAMGRNVGKAEAVRRGMLRAFAEGGDYIGFWDADLATPLREIQTFCSILDFRPEIEMVFGARVRMLGRSVGRRPLRHYLGRAFASAASMAIGLGVYDTQCGAKIFRATPEVMELFRAPFLTRWIFDVEILARLKAARRGTNRTAVEEVVYEFPLHEWNDVAGSKLKSIDMARAFLGLAAICWRYRGRRTSYPTGPTAPFPGKPHRVAPTAPMIADKS